MDKFLEISKAIKETYINNRGFQEIYPIFSTAGPVLLSDPRSSDYLFFCLFNQLIKFVSISNALKVLFESYSMSSGNMKSIIPFALLFRTVYTDGIFHRYIEKQFLEGTMTKDSFIEINLKYHLKEAALFANQYEKSVYSQASREDAVTKSLLTMLEKNGKKYEVPIEYKCKMTNSDRIEQICKYNGKTDYGDGFKSSCFRLRDLWKLFSKVEHTSVVSAGVLSMNNEKLERHLILASSEFIVQHKVLYKLFNRLDIPTGGVQDQLNQAQQRVDSLYFSK